MIRSTMVLMAAASLFAVVVPAHAGPATVSYQLDATSRFETGCFPPCLCPYLFQSPLKGTFTLTPAGFDGLFQHFDVSQVVWRVTGETGEVPVTGTGHYRVGGEVAVQQELTLDLSVDGAPARRYASGLVPGGQDFPAIDVDVALHGFFCHDSAYGVRARPAAAGVGELAGTAALRIGPNPFQERTWLQFTLAESGPLFASIHEPSGRRVRTLAAGEPRGAGVQILGWDGRGDDGRPAGAGVYFVSLRAAGREVRGALVKIGTGR